MNTSRCRQRRNTTSSTTTATPIAAVWSAGCRRSPWRQAVDLGNMVLVLAVRTDAERVYRRALDYFTPDELAEAFAATRGWRARPSCARS